MHQIIQKSVMRLLSPLVRLLLRHGISHAEFSNWAKQAFVWEAEKHFGVESQTQSPALLLLLALTAKKLNGFRSYLTKNGKPHHIIIAPLVW